MSELVLATEVIANMPGHWESIESHMTSLGFPDMDYCMAGCAGQLELKYGKGYDMKIPKVRPGQYAFFRKRTKAKGQCHILVKIDNWWKEDDGPIYGIIPGDRVPQLKIAKNNQDWLNLCDRWWKESEVWDGLMVYLFEAFTKRISGQ